VTLHEHRDIDSLENGGFARFFCETNGEYLSVMGGSIERRQRAETVGPVCNTGGVMERRVLETVKTEATKRTADSTVGRRRCIEHPEWLVVLPQLGETRLRQRKTAGLRHLLNRHVAETNDLHAEFIGDLAECLCNPVIRLTKLDNVVVGHSAPVDGLISKVPMGDEKPASILTNERMMNVQVALDQLHFRSRLVAT
jgi:hypothetical protein